MPTTALSNLCSFKQCLSVENICMVNTWLIHFVSISITRISRNYAKPFYHLYFSLNTLVDSSCQCCILQFIIFNPLSSYMQTALYQMLFENLIAREMFKRITFIQFNIIVEEDKMYISSNE